jgi:hypothetical protein
MKTAVAMFLFNRPSLTAQVFARVREARPKKLLLVADGPRTEQERQPCEAVRQVVEQADWDCDVRRNFSDVNLGCRNRMSTGIDWVFSQVDKAILLEDDCLPDPTFFPFCTELLERYRDDPRVMMISGDNFQFGRRRTPHSYYFSRIPHIWGWATWRRAWRHYDASLREWPILRDADFLDRTFDNPRFADSYRRIFDETAAGRIDTWDHQWAFAFWRQKGLCVLPEVNLITNLGFGPDATHTRNSASADSALPAMAMKFPLSHPSKVECCVDADAFTLDSRFGRRSAAA